MESHILSTHKFCGAIKKNWWDIHSLCLCFVSQPSAENGNLKMIKQENSPALSMLTLYSDNFLHHLPVQQRLLWAQRCPSKNQITF